MQLMQAKEIRKIIVFDMKIHLKENLKRLVLKIRS